MDKRFRATLRVIIVIAVLLCMFSTLQAQDSVLRYFYGGAMNLDIAQGSQILTGPGISSVVSGGIAPSNPDAFQVFRNPAGMRYIYQRPEFGYTFKLPLSIKWPEMIQTEMDTQVYSVLAGYNRTGPLITPTVQGGVGYISNALSSFAYVHPVYPWQFGLGYARLYQLNMDLVFAGISQRIDSVDPDPTREIQFIANIAVRNRLQFSADEWVFAASRDLGDSFTLGFSASRTYFDFKMEGGYNVDAMMTRVGQIYAFGDDSDPWYNELGGIARGDYTGSSYALKLGMQYVPGWEDSWRIGAELKVATKASMDGEFLIQTDAFPLINLSPNEGEERFDVTRIADITQMTETYPNRSYPSSTMYFHVPSSFSVGISRAKGIRPSLSFSYYMGDLGYELDIREKGYADTEYSTNTYSIGFDPNFQAYLGINPGRFFLGVGVVHGRVYSTGHKNPDNKKPIIEDQTVLIPRFDMGFSFMLMNNLEFEILLDGLPEDMLRMGLTYVF